MKEISWCWCWCLMIFCSPLLLAQSIDSDQWSDKKEIEFRVSDEYFSSSSGLNYTYLKQTHCNIDIYNAITIIITDQNNRKVHEVNKFMNPADFKDIESHLLQPPIAIKAALNNLGLHQMLRSSLSLQPKANNRFVWKAPPNISKLPITCQAQYLATLSGGLVPIYEVKLIPNDFSAHWQFLINATSGELMQRNNLAKYCQPHHQEHLDQECIFAPQSADVLSQNPWTQGADGAAYQVFPFPYTSPQEVSPQVVMNPADSIASPFGWHDTNGAEGAEFTITRGNNAYVYLDRNGDFDKDADEPDGGNDLQFLFPFDLSKEPDEYQNGSTAQLFYQLNVLHDLTYHYGFDEQVNFQNTNFSAQGKADDEIFGLVQYGSDRNNKNGADIITSADGARSYMRPMVWTRLSNRQLKIIAPPDASAILETGSANYGPSVSSQSIEGELAIYQDDSFNPTFGCEAASNPQELNGKIVIIDRGDCFFNEKTLNAQNAGAIGCIICNFEDVTVLMGPSEGFPEPNIPTLSVGFTDCNVLKSLVAQGAKVRFEVPESTGADEIDATLDNAVVAHEYFHGISERLVGGASTTSCLSNIFYDDDEIADDGEQMGEGWSDFFALYMTTNSTREAKENRPIATYLLRQSPDSRGLRRYPYSTDFTSSAFTYQDVWSASIPHGVGAVWGAVLWDVYWAMVEKYGFDDNLYTGNGGNNRTLHLVMESLLLSPCSPGFIDGRDALLKADELLYGGENQCLLWDVFSKRGLGFGALQGDPNINTDGKVSFDPYPACLGNIEVNKSVTKYIQPGDPIQHHLQVINHTSTPLNNLTVTDQLDNRLSLIPGSHSHPVSGNIPEMIFTISQINPGDTVVITYDASSNPGIHSKRQVFDDMEKGDTNWDIFNREGSFIWNLEAKKAHSGNNAWFVPNTETDNDQVLQWGSPITVSGNFPVMRIYHLMKSQWGLDGGIIEVSSDDGIIWDEVSSLLFRNGYDGPLSYHTFAQPDLYGFYGNRRTQFEDCYLDLRPYRGQNILIRFRFGSDDSRKDEGWYIDDFEIIDLINYSTEVCVRADGIQEICVYPSEEGTLVASAESSPVTTLDEDIPIRIYPNPARNWLNFHSENLSKKAIEVRIVDVLGAEITTFNWSGDSHFRLSTVDWVSGLYFVQLSDGHRSKSVKVSIFH